MPEIIQKKSKPKFSMLYWLVFVLGIVALSQFFGAHNYFLAKQDSQGVLVIIFSVITFFLSMLFMTYKIYSEEKDKNNLRVSFAPYEKLYMFLNKGAKN
ncbi:MAG: hypothetical protein ACKO3R_09290 [bacterium]